MQIRRGWLIQYIDHDEYWPAAIDRPKPDRWVTFGRKCKPIVLPSEVAKIFNCPLFGQRTKQVMVKGGRIIGRRV